MTQAQTPSSSPPVSPDQIPTLTQDMALAQVPQAVHVALDARVAEKQALMESPTLEDRVEVLTALLRIDAAESGDGDSQTSMQ